MHAYLIMAHGNILQLLKLLELLDDERNDIFVHMDKKNENFNSESLRKSCKLSKVHVLDKRNDVSWGKSIQSITELELYKAAHKKGYKYYHLCSGSCLPVRTQDYIHTYFDSLDGFNFLYYHNQYSQWNYRRVSRYHFPFGRRINAICMALQEILNIDRIANKYPIFKRGYNWCSLTHEAVSVLLSNESSIKSLVRLSKCADEVYKQLVLLNSHLKQTIHHDANGIATNLWYVDWREGGDHPKVLSEEDLDKIYSTNCLFARKFDLSKTPHIIDCIHKRMKMFS